MNALAGAGPLSTLTLVKVVDSGPAPASAFTLSAVGAETVQGAGAGEGSVLDAAVLPGTYTLGETGPAHYTASDWTCVDDGRLPTSHPVTGGTVALGLDEDVTCTVHNAAVPTGYDVAKTAEITDRPGPGGTVLPGGTVEYTLTARWLDGIAGKPVVIEDDLTDVLANADLVAVPAGAELVTRTVDGQPHLVMVWTIAELSDEVTPVTLTYSVLVDDNDAAWGQHLVNAVTPVTTGGGCVPGKCSTDTPTPPKPTLTLEKVVVNGLGGTAETTDWTLSATPEEGVHASQGTVAVAGGVADQPVWPGSYDLAEALAAQDGPHGYSDGGWTCSNAEGTVSTVNLAVGDDVTCSITNTQDAEWEVVKSSDPAGVVSPDQVITYSVAVTHTAGVNPTGIVVEDQMAGWNEYATLQDDSFSVVEDGVERDLLPGELTHNGDDTFTWAVGEVATSKVLAYRVTVDHTTKGVTLVNAITTNGNHCPADLVLAFTVATDGPMTDVCSTSNPVPSWTLRKDSDPATGDFVEGGQQVTYTLTVTNTSATTPLVGATVTDDLTEVMDNATMVTAFPSSGATYDATVGAERITWAVPTLEPLATTTLVYTVQVNAAYANGTVLHNVSAVGATDGEHPVNQTGSCQTVPEGSSRTSMCETTVGTAVVEPPIEETPPVVVPTNQPGPSSPAVRQQPAAEHRWPERAAPAGRRGAGRDRCRAGARRPSASHGRLTPSSSEADLRRRRSPLED